MVVVGATDAVGTVVQRHSQIGSVFSHPVVLDPLPLPDVRKLLDRRYQALQLDPNGHGGRPSRMPWWNSYMAFSVETCGAC